jgi:parvulin-like peptidyl-prolyl isomerase
MITAMVRFSRLTLESEDIISFLKQEVKLKDICQQMLYQQIVARAAQERGIGVTPDEIQMEADRQRYEKRLESAAATFNWLAEQLITPEEWEAGIRNHLLARKLAEHLFGRDVERYFAEHRLDFEKIVLYKITVPYQQLSQELFYQIEENEISFYEAAHLYDIDERRRLQCGYEGKLYRWSLTPEIAAVVFAARVGEVVGPLPSEQGYDLLMVENIIAAELNAELRQEITDRMFQEWLESELNHLIHNNTFS